MVKQLIIFLSLISSLFSEDIYEKNCVKCHKDMPMSLQRMFMSYLKAYSGEENFKAGLKHYLKYPIKEISVMSDLFIVNYPIKKSTKLTDKELDEILDIYWAKYKVIGRLK